ncbi:MAG: hypothetical protein GC158_00745 [Cyanobacteria bacterium RI_101]|jgi:hypothetical protein|nr:hypothetical protein [Cyanobacteria bacterium RI_101]
MALPRLSLLRLLSLSLGLLLFLGGWLAAPAAWALTEIPLKNIQYKDCPPALAQGSVLSGSNDPANCFLITGTAVNKTGKTVYDADVFGRIYDANNEPALQNRTRVGNIAEIPPGTSEFEVRVSVPAEQPLPLRLEQFKAAGFTAKIRSQAL